MILAEDELQLLPDENLYIDDFSAPHPPFHFWSNVSDGFDGPMLGLVACFDQNVSGMEPTSGCGYRLVDANLNAFQNRIQDFFQHATLDDAINSVSLATLQALSSNSKSNPFLLALIVIFFSIVSSIKNIF